MALPTSAVVFVAGVRLSASHTLSYFRGLYFCTACGHVAGARARKLAHDCPKVCLGSGLRVLRDIQSGKLPWGMKAWPAEQGCAESLMIQL